MVNAAWDNVDVVVGGSHRDHTIDIRRIIHTVECLYIECTCYSTYS
jgi:hypothetical protein